MTVYGLERKGYNASEVASGGFNVKPSGRVVTVPIGWERQAATTTAYDVGIFRQIVNAPIGYMGQRWTDAGATAAFIGFGASATGADDSWAFLV